MNLHVDSEVGRLRQVILHRPDLELKRLTPTNHDEYLFDDVLWVKRAKQEHDAFAETLRDLGVEVHLLDQLLRETVAIPEARKYILEEALDERVYGPMAMDSLHRVFGAMDDTELTRYLIGGMTKRELLERTDEPSSVVVQALDLDDVLLPPLPNHLFTRDTSAWIYDGVSINAMRKRARIRETIHYEAIYRWHPFFADARLQRLVRRHGQRTGHHRGRRHPRPRPRRRPGRHERAHHTSRRRAPGQAAVPRRQRHEDRCAGHASEARVHAPRHRDDDGRRPHLHQVRRPRDAAVVHDRARATPSRS